MHHRSFLAIAVVLPLLGGAPGAGAADTPSPASAKVDHLAAARNLIKVEQWPAAIAELKRVGDDGGADWANLMGYALRKSSPPDLEAAERYYNDALRIDPKHRGALEYSGELYLMKGDLARAEERLKALDKACFLPCEEYTDLKKAVERYKANGNRYVAGS
jgi:tetratricopeptide (TPR) repeat protein